MPQDGEGAGGKGSHNTRGCNGGSVFRMPLIFALNIPSLFVMKLQSNLSKYLEIPHPGVHMLEYVTPTQRGLSRHGVFAPVLPGYAGRDAGVRISNMPPEKLPTNYLRI